MESNPPSKSARQGVFPPPWASPVIAVIAGAVMFASFFAFEKRPYPIRLFCIGATPAFVAGGWLGIAGLWHLWGTGRWPAIICALVALLLNGGLAYFAIVAVLYTFAK